MSGMSQIAYCKAPDPTPRKPRLHVPLGATDTHFHIMGPANVYPYIEEREYTPPDATPPAYEHLHRTLGIQRAVLIQPSVYGQDNSCMANSARQLGLPTRMIVVVPLDVTDKELQRLHDAGARGVRFIQAHAGGLPLSDLHRLSERVKPLGWHVQFLLRPVHLIALESSLLNLATEFVIDHVGLIRTSAGGINHPAFEALLRLFGTGRCWVKLTGAYRISSQEPPFRDVIPLVAALLKERPDRLLWGSDWPHVTVNGEMPNTTDLLDLLLDWVPDENDRKLILVDNPQALFGF
jgi:predicted TIM-barrel fold metal-dependent hydrolase